METDQASPSSKPRPSGLHFIPPGPPQNRQVPITAPIVPKDPGTLGISAAEGGRVTGLKKVHGIRAHGVRGLDRVQESVSDARRRKREERQRLRGREIEMGREKRRD